MGKHGKSGSGKRGKSKSKGKGKGKGGAAGVKKGKLKADPGAKGGKKGAAKGKGAGGKGGGKDGDKKGDAADAKGKGKGKARAPPGAPKMTRKERKKASIARAKGFTPKTAEETPKKPTVNPLGQAKLKKGKRVRPGQSKRQGGDVAKAAPKADEAAKKKRVRVRNRSGHSQAKVKEPEPVKCKKGHSMGHRSDNPATYKNQACCDVCGKENLPKLCSKGKLSHFFHCSFCKFDMCPDCSVNKLSGSAKGKDGNDEKSGKKKDKQKDQKAPEPADFIPRVRRERWIPTEAESVNRAPLKSVVLSDWVEGKPL